MNLIDTADSYGPEVSENLIAEALYPYPDGPRDRDQGRPARAPGPASGRATAARSTCSECCEGSLRRLRLDRIDLYQLHRVDPKVPLEDSFGALEELQDEGKIRHIGISQRLASRSSSARARSCDVVTVQNRYNLADRHAEDVLDACDAEGIGFIPWFPLATGDLARPGRPARRARARSRRHAGPAGARLAARSARR